MKYFIYIVSAFVFIMAYAVYYAIEKDWMLVEWGSRNADRVFSWGMFLGATLIFFGLGWNEKKNNLIKWCVYYWVAIYFSILLWIYIINAMVDSMININKPLICLILTSAICMIALIFRSLKRH